MEKKIIMEFWRDEFADQGCLEYSWVPEGKRHNISLLPGMQNDSSTDSISDGLNPSHVEVYVAINGRNTSVVRWQFPSGPPAPSPIARARIELFEQRMIVVGTIYYEDGTMGFGWKSLEKEGRRCPEHD